MMTVSDGLAFCALILSGYAVFQTARFNRKQIKFSQNQDRLTDALLKKESDERDKVNCADVGASFVRVGSNKLRLKVFNKGLATAKNVRLDFPNGDHGSLLVSSDFSEKFPYEELHQHQSVELLACAGLGGKSKYHIVITWDDPSGKDKSNPVYLSI